jgi:hypothetical protein
MLIFVYLGDARLQYPEWVECSGCFWTRQGLDKNQRISRVYNGLHCTFELCGTSVVLENPSKVHDSFFAEICGLYIIFDCKVDYWMIMEHPLEYLHFYSSFLLWIVVFMDLT